MCFSSRIPYSTPILTLNLAQCPCYRTRATATCHLFYFSHRPSEHPTWHPPAPEPYPTNLDIKFISNTRLPTLPSATNPTAAQTVSTYRHRRTTRQPCPVDYQHGTTALRHNMDARLSRVWLGERDRDDAIGTGPNGLG